MIENFSLRDAKPSDLIMFEDHLFGGNDIYLIIASERLKIICLDLAGRLLSFNSQINLWGCSLTLLTHFVKHEVRL